MLIWQQLLRRKLNVECRHANIPAFGGILPLFTPFPAIPRGIHDIPFLQMWHNVINRTDNIQLGIYYLSLNMRYCPTRPVIC
jgi:hypothetical protein